MSKKGHGKVSLIIPVYNAQKSLGTCLQSVCNQSYEDIEVILIDDGSSDESPCICDAWAMKDARIKVVHQENGGVSAARNAGIDVATGDFVMFADADDWLELNCVEEAIAGYRSGKFIIYGYWAERGSKGSITQRIHVVVASDPPVASSGIVLAVELFKKGLFGAVWNKVYERALLQQNAIRFDEGMSLGEDVVFNLAYLCSLPDGELVLINRPLYHYFEHNKGSLNNSFNPAFLECQIKLFGDFEEALARAEAPRGAFSHLQAMKCSAFIVSIDNAYENRNQIGSYAYENQIKKVLAALGDIDKDSKIVGFDRFFVRCRIFLLRHHGYLFDYRMREGLKRILGLM